MGVMTSRPSCCYCVCCFSDCGCRRFFRSLCRAWVFFQWKIASVKRERTHMKGEPHTKVVKGFVTSCGKGCGWIEECVFFSTESVPGSVYLQPGDKVLAFVEEDPVLHDLKATEVCIVLEYCALREPSSIIRDLSACVSYVKKDIIYLADEYFFYLDSISKAILGFQPYKGDWLDLEYSLECGSSKLTIHSLKATRRRRLEEVCVTSIHRREGMLNHTIFFTFHSLKLPNGYTPLVGHMVNVVMVQSIRPKYNWRAISMKPVEAPPSYPMLQLSFRENVIFRPSPE
ncbi:cancer/testis antigen 55-like [Acomys russatus]|uniref:cancer/testis antigen 55-like n=1 Tax=Acomys russatus TaxID=60746 RepID=UPI0021E1DA9B|nr:cancer/testis antigen 55-like [Acomys russatus]